MNTVFELSPSQVMKTPSAPEGQSKERTVDTEALVEMMRSNSEVGFNVLYDKYSAALYSILFRIVKRKDVADDLLQDSFVKIWKHINGFEPSRGTLFTWMLNITRNLAIDHIRSSGHRNHLLHKNLECPSLRKDLVVAITGSNCEVEYDDFKSKALGLDPKCAEVIDMIFFHGWSHAQTAAILQLPLGTVKSRSRKALSLLKILYQR